MPRGHDLSEFTKGMIYGLSKHANFSNIKISEVLHISINTVKRYLATAHKSDTGLVNMRPNNGSKRKTTAIQDEELVNLSSQNPFMSCVQLRNQLRLPISRRSVCRRLLQNGLKGRSPANKPLLTTNNIARRLNWAIVHSTWTSEHWTYAVFSDESTFYVGRGHRKYVRRRNGQRYRLECIETQENASKGSVNVWGAFGWHNYTNLVEITGRLNSAAYINILNEHLLPLYDLVPDGTTTIFVQDNCPVHTSQATTNWLEEHNITLLDWPAYSPDINVIENVWGIMKQRIRKMAHQPSTRADLFAAMQRLWTTLMSNNVWRHSLIRSMPRRVLKLRQARGKHTKY